MSLLTQVEKRLKEIEEQEVTKEKALQRAEELDKEFSFIKPKTDIPSPERFFGLPAFSK